MKSGLSSSSIKNNISSYLQKQNELKIKKFKQQLNRVAQCQNLYYQDESTYFGQLSPQKDRSGIGLLSMPTGDIYLGDWHNNQYQGYGIYIYQNGQRYQGNLYQGQKHGQGTYYFVDGRVYQGNWQGGVKQGFGKEIFTDGVIFQGYWRGDIKDGQGRILINNTQTHNNTSAFRNHSQQVLLEGIWVSGFFSEGKVNTPNYQGEYSNNNLNGLGIYKYSGGSVYKGNFLHGEKHGAGVYYFANGDFYQGLFQKGLKHGKGIYKYFTGDIYEGSYHNDLKWGQGKFIFINGNQYIGMFQRDLFHGKGKYYFNHQQCLSGYFQNGQISQNSIGNIGNQNINRTSNKSHIISSSSKTPNTSTNFYSQIKNYPYQQTHKQTQASSIKDSKFMQIHLSTNLSSNLLDHQDQSIKQMGLFKEFQPGTNQSINKPNYNKNNQQRIETNQKKKFRKKLEY